MSLEKQSEKKSPKKCTQNRSEALYKCFVCGLQVSLNADEDDSDSDDDDSECDIYDETSLENYTTPIDDEDTGVDEYQIFEETFKGLQASNLEWYNQLTSAMSADQQKAVQEIVLLANQRKAARQSKSIQMSGGEK